MSAGSGSAGQPFDVDAFLAQPLVARVATAAPAAAVRPVWYLWEDGAFWWLTGRWSRLPATLDQDRRVALVVDTCDLSTGRTWQVTATGPAEVVAFDPRRTERKLCRYLGPDPDAWDPRFRSYLVGEADLHLVRLVPETLVARDLSFRASSR